MHYAAYGSNLHPLRLTRRTPSARLLGVGFLSQWSLRFHKRSQDRSGKCSIVAGDIGVHFAVFALSTDDKLALDRIEGVGSGYSEIALGIPGFGPCASYVAEESHVDDSLQPYDWYRELVLEGMRFHGFPDDYLKTVEMTESYRDPDLERRARNWKTVRRARACS